MNGSETPSEALYVSETVVRDAIAAGHFTLAIGLLVQHYQDAIISYCRCHVFDLELAREVAQEVFLAAFEGMADFRGRSSMKTWLYGIAFKKCLEFGRNTKRRELLLQSHQDTIRVRAHCPAPEPPEEIVGQESRRHQVWQALHALPVYERELLVLRYLEELTYEEIAGIVNVSRRTVERHLPRAEARFLRAYERWQTHAVSTRQTHGDATTYAGLVALVQDASPS